MHIVVVWLLLLCSLAARSRAPAPDVARRGSQLIDRRTGMPLVLKGVSTEFAEGACVAGGRGIGMFAGPIEQSIRTWWSSWGVNAVRLPLNEDCWLGQHGAPVCQPICRIKLRPFNSIAKQLQNNETVHQPATKS
jgi:hypothetical protein